MRTVRRTDRVAVPSLVLLARLPLPSAAQRDARSPDPWLAERAESRLRLVWSASVADPESSEIPF